MLPEEASGLECENREGCKTCNTDEPFFCDECEDDFTLQKLEGQEYGYCTPDLNPDEVDLNEVVPEEASGLLCENRETCIKCNEDDPFYCDICNNGFALQKLQD